MTRGVEMVRMLIQTFNAFNAESDCSHVVVIGHDGSIAGYSRTPGPIPPRRSILAELYGRAQEDPRQADRVDRTVTASSGKPVTETAFYRIRSAS